MNKVSYRPPRMLAPRDDRATLAAQDRDLLAEARDEEGCCDAALAVICKLYPPITLAGTVRPVMFN